MVVEFTFPDVGEGVTEGTLLKWLVSEGDAVTEDESLAEVETDKAVVEVPAPTDGTIKELRAEEGDLINVGDIIVVIAEEGEDTGTPAQDDAEDAEAAEDTDGTDEDIDTEQEPPAGQDSEDVDVAVDEEMAELVADHTVDEVKHRVERDDLDPVAVLAAEQDGQERKTLISWLEDRIAAEDVPESTAIVGTLSEEEQSEAADGEETESREADRQEEAAEPSGDVLAVPAARRLARDEGVDLASVTGSGPDGAVTVSDVKDAMEGGAAEARDAGEPGAGAAEPSGKVLAAPSTRRLAREKGVDIATVEGSGPGGRVTTADVEAAAGAEPETGEGTAGEPAETREPVAEAARPGALGETFGSSGRRFEPKTYDFAQWGEVEREELSGTRRAIARQMERSKYTAPHVTSMDEADVTDLWELRAKEKGVAEQKGVHLTFMPFIMKAVISALKDYPLLNASLDETSGEIVKKHYHNIGVAVATDDGLLVPTIKDADDKSILELARDINTLAEKARDRELSLEEMKGGTFTITNWGSIGGSYGTPILNYPEVGILGTGVIEEKPVVVDGEVTVRKVLPLSLTFDHRVVDGAYAAQFLNELVTHLEDPDLLLIDE